VDLGVALAVASAAEEQVVPSDLVVFGELGLAGEVRAVPGADRRLAEAWRAGFIRALVPPSLPDEACPPGMQIQRVRTLDEALASTIPLWSNVAVSR
jgi:DNA repair protein RadA/Sms